MTDASAEVNAFENSGGMLTFATTIPADLPVAEIDRLVLVVRAAIEEATQGDDGPLCFTCGHDEEEHGPICAVCYEDVGGLACAFYMEPPAAVPAEVREER